MDKPHIETNKTEPGEIERLRAELAAARRKLVEYEQSYWARRAGRNRLEADTQRILLLELLRSEASAHLDENLRQRMLMVLSDRTEPSGPLERDERAKFEALVELVGVDLYRNCDGDYRNQGIQDLWAGWKARAAIDRKS